MITISKYDERPGVSVSPRESDCAQGWGEVLDVLKERKDARRIAIECFHGVQLEPLKRELVAKLGAELVLESSDALLLAAEIDAKFAAGLTDDPVFGYLTKPKLEEYFDAMKIAEARVKAASTEGRVVAIGIGASLMIDWDLLIYVDVPLGDPDAAAPRTGAEPGHGQRDGAAVVCSTSVRSFWIGARWREKHELFKRVDFWIDGNLVRRAKDDQRRRDAGGAGQTVPQPFLPCRISIRDPGAASGCDGNSTFPGPSNYAWCFNACPKRTAWS